MEGFLELEGAYLVIGLFVLAVTLFVTTRKFVSGGNLWKKAIPTVIFIMSGFIMAHYFTTTARMVDVQKRFNNGGAVICENKAIRKVAQSIIIDPNKPQGWVLDGDIFKSGQYERGFHSARCLEYFYPNEIKK